MHLNRPCPGSNEIFDEGIIKGSVWYELRNGMQDYNYAFADCMELTLELSCCKYPNVTQLPKFWKENREALVTYIEQVSGHSFDVFDCVAQHKMTVILDFRRYIEV